MAHLDGAAADFLGRLQPAHDLARGEDLDLEPPVGHLRDDLGEHFRRAVDGVERLRESSR